MTRTGLVAWVVMALVGFAGGTRADELTADERAWARGVARALGDPSVEMTRLSVALPAQKGDREPPRAIVLRAVGREVEVERSWLPTPDQALRVTPLGSDEGAARPRVGEARGRELVVVHGRLGDAAWARSVLDAAWGVFPTPREPRATIFAWLSDDETAIAVRSLEGQPGRYVQAMLGQVSSLRAKLERLGTTEGLSLNGPEDVTVCFRGSGKASRVGRHDPTGRAWALTAHDLPTLAHVESYLFGLGVRLPRTRS